MFPFEQFSIEMIVVFAIGLMVLGPKDLPVVMRKIGQFVAKMRGMAAEFRASFDELARQSELDELRKEVEALRTGAHVQIPDGAPSADPAYAYKPFDDAASGLDSTGFSFPPQPSTTQPPIMAEGLPPDHAEVPVAKPGRKPRAKKTGEMTIAAAEPAPEAEVDAEPSKAVRKARTPKRTSAESAIAKSAAE